MSDRGEKRDLVLTPENFAYMQDITNGVIKTHVGPSVINQTAQERPVLYNSETGSFVECGHLEEAVSRAPVVPEGFYLVLKNPVDENSGDEHPGPGSAGKPSPALRIGRKEITPGPCMFALWPGQSAKVIRGHHLRSNQYLLVRVYNEEEARRNWSKAVMKKASEAGDEGVLSDKVPQDLTVGRQLVIKGTEVSFYIPPTGISVVPEGSSYVRNALTLERLEYCILVDEDGNKRYERGPQVVFPAPTETFISDKGAHKFKAVELNEIQGLHIKVIAPYEDSDGTEHREGDELFITGKETAIYFPREEHSLLRYDGKFKHFATAIPDKGEGRYVMDRISGEIETIRGPAMLLPDPRNQVIVRRVLSQRQCSLWYPENKEVSNYNAHLESLLKRAPTTRQGVISEGDFSRGTSKKSGQRRHATAEKMLMESSNQNSDQHLVGEEFSRGSTYTEPRTVTLDTKLQGVPTLDIWNGYAVMIRNRDGNRQVVEGPTTVLLDYSQTLEVIELSTGKPKTTDNLLRTVYLRTKNNFVTDEVRVETSDKVKVRVKIQLKGDFTGDPNKWFDVENYVKQSCDHVRSVLKGKTRSVTVAEFYAKPEDFIRDAILGESKEGSRKGMFFEQFGFKITDVEILEVEIKDAKVRDLLDANQHEVVESNLRVARERRELEVTKESQSIQQEDRQVRQQTLVLGVALQEEADRITHETKLADQQRKAQVASLNAEAALASAAAHTQQEMKLMEPSLAKEHAKIEQSKARQDLALTRLTAETQAAVDRAQAITPELACALREFVDAKKMGDLVSNFGEMAAVKGLGTLAAAQQVLDFLPENALRVQETKE